MKWGHPYFSNRQKISLLQRWIIVQSYLYYELNETIVSDFMFDANCKQLVEMMAKYPRSNRESDYYYAFKDFDGSTGFHLMSRLTKKDSEWIKKIVTMLSRKK